MMAATTEPTTTAGPVVQIINGEIVLQASSMVVPNVRKTVAELEEELKGIQPQKQQLDFIVNAEKALVGYFKKNDFTLEEVKAAHSKVKSGADFPNYIQEIIQLGVEAYDVFVADGHAVYFGKNNFKI